MCIQGNLRLNNIALFVWCVCLIKTFCCVVQHLRQLAPPRGSRGDVLTKQECGDLSSSEVRVSGWVLTLLLAKKGAQRTKGV